jgi:DeoR/GlpR family transcriptional regulator of sugar metabolism
MASEELLNARQQLLLKIINEKEYVSIKELKKEIDVSEATIRRDLDEMSQNEIIGRVHGGAIKLTSTSHEPFQTEKMGQMTEEKKRIAKYVSSLVRPGNSIFLDSGTTTLYIAEAIKEKKNLTIVTDNLDVAYMVSFDPSSTVIFTGGMIRRDFSVVVGPITEDTISKFKVDITFVACDAIDPDSGLYNVNYLEVGVKKAITKCGRKTVLVSDHTKFGSCSFAFVCPLDDIDCIISDTGLSPAIVTKLKKNKIDVVLC